MQVHARARKFITSSLHARAAGNVRENLLILSVVSAKQQAGTRRPRAAATHTRSLELTGSSLDPSLAIRPPHPRTCMHARIRARPRGMFPADKSTIPAGAAGGRLIFVLGTLAGKLLYMPWNG